MTDTPQERAKVIIDPSHPEAGRGGVVPPLHSRIKPGETLNPGGRPRGSSTLAPFLREMAKDPDEDGYGAKAVAAAHKLVEAVLSGDKDAAMTVLAIMDRTDGPLVKERVNTNTHLVQGIALHDRGAPVPIPGATQSEQPS